MMLFYFKIYNNNNLYKNTNLQYYYLIKRLYRLTFNIIIKLLLVIIYSINRNIAIYFLQLFSIC